MAQIEYDAIFAIAGYGVGDDYGYGQLSSYANNILIGTNPPYASADFFAMYPKFQALNVPAPVFNAYIAYASGCLSQARYMDMWQLVMGLFIAHYVTLYLKSDGPAVTVATAGMAAGIQTSKNAGDVSVGYTPLQMPEAGAFALTVYGQQLWQLGMALGSGGMLLV